MRSHTCGDLTIKDVGKKVTLCGWDHSRRDHGGLIFIDIRDRYGLTQIVFHPDKKDIFRIAESLRREDVIQVTGKVARRPKGMENKSLKTGQIEVIVDSIKIINKAQTPPLEIEDRIDANEEMRLKYRYLDLRRPKMQHYLLIRHKAMLAAMRYLDSKGFVHIETPMLVRSTPEGARDYIVPSRVNPGKFYALPQSPQLYKHILMIAGFDRYFQVARCLRDEDLRADRQPEHTQIDIEISFADVPELLDIYEGLIKAIFKDAGKIEFKEKFKVMDYEDAMLKYGTDKPDLRFGLELIDVTDIMTKSDFEVFKNEIKNKRIVKCINPAKDFSRNEIDDYIKFCQEHGAKGMAWMKVTKNELESNIVKYFSKELQKEIIKKTKAKNNSFLMFVAGKPKLVNEVLSKLRNKLGEDLGLIKKNEFKFCWIVNFPLFEWNEEESRWDPMHHIFTKPLDEDIKYLETDPGRVRCYQYDLVLNGVELGSGSLRIDNPELQERVMKVIGISHEQAQKRFGFLLEAYKYGAPTHGGIGLGFDRIVAMMLGFNDIRDVIAFPKNKAAECPMDDSPSEVDEKQLKELNIKTDIAKG